MFKIHKAGEFFSPNFNLKRGKVCTKVLSHFLPSSNDEWSSSEHDFISGSLDSFPCPYSIGGHISIKVTCEDAMRTWYLEAALSVTDAIYSMDYRVFSLRTQTQMDQLI